MTRFFEQSLDKALTLLYRQQYWPTIASEKNERGLRAWISPSDLKEHIRGIDFHQEDPDRQGPLPDETPSGTHAYFVYRQLLEDGHIEAGYVESVMDEMVSLTNKGRLFHEAGGYRGLSRSCSMRKTWTITKTIATAISTITIVWLSWRASQSAESDRLQDEQIVRLDSANAVLTRANTALESENRRLMRLALEHGSDSALTVKRP